MARQYSGDQRRRRQQRRIGGTGERAVEALPVGRAGVQGRVGEGEQRAAAEGVVARVAERRQGARGVPQRPPLMDYAANRKKADSASMSLLSPYLHFGELSVRKVFHQMI
uniref:Uncharacterized protein n=1 Tax=Oryza brachyantha TaxID=4533 RepID=J3LCR7_ORYBR